MLLYSRITWSYDSLCSNIIYDTWRDSAKPAALLQRVIILINVAQLRRKDRGQGERMRKEPSYGRKREEKEIMMQDLQHWMDGLWNFFRRSMNIRWAGSTSWQRTFLASSPRKIYVLLFAPLRTTSLRTVADLIPAALAIVALAIPSDESSFSSEQ